MSGVGFVTGVETSWGDVWERVGLVMGDWDVLDRMIELGIKNKGVEHNSVALDIVLLTNVVVLGLGGIGSSSGMAGALLDG